MKVAQILSTIPDALPAEYAAGAGAAAGQRAADGLVASSAAAWPASSGRTGSRKFTDLRPGSRRRRQPRPGAPRHPARRHARSPASCNIPDMPSTVDADLKQLKLAMSVYKRIDSVIDGDDIYAEIADRLREELDYLREASQMRLYRHHAARPRRRERARARCRSCTTKRLLTMTWLDGTPIQRWIDEDPPLEERNHLATRAVPRLVRAVLPLRRHPRRPAPRQLPGPRRQRPEPARFRRHPRVPAQLRPRRDRPLRGDPRRRHRQGAPRLRELGLPRT